MSKSNQQLRESKVTSNRGYDPSTIHDKDSRSEQAKDEAVVRNHLRRPGLGGKHVGP